MKHVTRSRSQWTRPRFIGLALLLAALGGCGRDTAVVGTALAGEVAPAEEWGSAASAIRAGYVERLRLGLGSPFRLIEFALADPRLDASERREIGLELLSRAARGDAYEVDPTALLPTLDAPRPEEIAWARAHLLVIDGTIADAPDPRVGELAVRLAYQLARVESTVDPRTLSAAVGIAGLRRDRALAMQDARRLIASARGSGIDPLELAVQWRRENRLHVEQPVLQITASRGEQQAIARAPYLLRSIRHAWMARPQPTSESPHREAEELRRLQVIADSMDMPPRAVVVVALRRTTPLLPASLSEDQKARWERFAETATDEEKLAAHWSDLVEEEPALRTALARAKVRAAVGLRTFAQERVWYPDMEAPTAAQLRARYGVHVRVARDVPERWLPFVLAGLDESLVDLRTVVPDLSVRGLEIEITRDPRISTSLASHSPQTRVLQWPVTTGPGTLAHEVAHDLDWQAGRRLSWIGRQYASEQALVRSPGSFGAALATLTPDVSHSPNAPRDNHHHATRPAEVVARTFDWFVVTRLAARGRWNGTLSSAQDDLLTGHGSLGPPGTSDAYGPAVIEALRPLVTIPHEERRAFLSEYGPVRWPQTNLVLRSAVGRLEPSDAPVLLGPAALLPMQPVRAVARARDEVLRELDVRYCTTRSPLVGFDIDAAYRGVVVQAAAARGRTLAVSLAEQIAGQEGLRWMRRELYGPLYPAGEVTPQELIALSAIVAEVRTLEEMPPQVVRSGFDVGTPLSSCRLAVGSR